jgi:hypothetical protein
MNKRIPLGKVIARRELRMRNTEHPVVVSIGTPKHIGGGWDWACPYSISGLGKLICGHVHGIDALQALQLVSTGIRQVLEQSGCELTFEGCSDLGLAFPKLIPSFGDPRLEHRLVKLLVAETTRWVKRHKAAEISGGRGFAT